MTSLVQISPAAGRDLRLRPATVSDLPALQALLLAAELPTSDLSPALLPGFVLAERNGRLVGAAGVEARGAAGLLRSVAVRSELRGTGIGEQLVRDRIAWARARGILTLGLLTTTAADWFPRFGFRTVARAAFPAELQTTTEYRELCAESSTAQTLALDDAAAVRTLVQEKYGAAARQAAKGRSASCGCGCGDEAPAISSDLYSAAEAKGLPVEAMLASLGCGNPTALAELRPGEVVLDLGSGGGIDVLLSARRVGPTGKAYGLDMTDDMLALARENQRRAGVENVEFLRGEIEAIPLPDRSVDVIISNCVINLSTDKRRVLEEAFRVLKPGGRFAVSDIVVRGAMPPAVRQSLELWAGCIAGALEEEEYQRLLAAAGFEGIEIEPTRIYGTADILPFAGPLGYGKAEVEALDGRFISGFVRARKPLG